MPHSDTQPYEFNRQLIWAGFRQLVPISLFVPLSFGVAFGLAATQAGMEDRWIILMSMTVFAGAAQFAALDLWGTQVPLTPLLITVFAINARHLLMGATLHPWLAHLSPAQRYGTMFIVSDVNWAMAMHAFHRGQSGLGILVGGGLALWLFWMVGTWLGISLGAAIHDPQRLGLDMVMGCFLLAMVAGGEKSLRMLAVWVAAAASSLFAYRYLPDNSHVVVGALVGGIVGMFWKEEKREH